MKRREFIINAAAVAALPVLPSIDHESTITPALPDGDEKPTAQGAAYIPPLVILIKGGRLHENTYKHLEEGMEKLRKKGGDLILQVPNGMDIELYRLK